MQGVQVEMKKIRVYQTIEFPCPYEDLVVKGKQGKITIATIYTEGYAKKYTTINSLPRIKKSKNGIYDIVVDASEINNEIVRNALKDLEKKTHKKYKFICKKTAEDKIFKYAEQLIEYGERFRTKKGYNLDRAKTPREKTQIIRGWIGEMLYEAEVYKNLPALKSLEKTIAIEIKDLIKQK